LTTRGQTGCNVSRAPGYAVSLDVEGADGLQQNPSDVVNEVGWRPS
jgi:hypothetical protein